MATYRNVLLAVLIAVIAGVRFPRQCSDTCCAGEFSLGSKCEKLRTCSDKGQYIIRAGNETQNNKCWCDECNRFAPIRPKRCWEKGQACGCKQCPEGTEPHIKDKNGQYVEHFDEDKHCKPLPNPNCTCACEPTGNKIGHWIGIGIAIGLVVCFVEWCIPWIYYCRRYKKYTFPFKFMPKVKDLPEANTQAEVKDSPEANTQAEDQRNLLEADALTEDPPNTNRSPESVSRTRESGTQTGPISEETPHNRIAPGSTVPSNSRSGQSPSATRTTSDPVDNPPAPGNISAPRPPAPGNISAPRPSAIRTTSDPVDNPPAPGNISAPRPPAPGNNSAPRSMTTTTTESDQERGAVGGNTQNRTSANDP